VTNGEMVCGSLKGEKQYVLCLRLEVVGKFRLAEILCRTRRDTNKVPINLDVRDRVGWFVNMNVWSER
jgi:hypothetical protein